jgi:hypothetical protein
MNAPAMPFQAGVTFGFYARNGWFASEQARVEVERMADLGVGWVVLTPTVLQETAHSTRQYRDFEITPGDHELTAIIGALHSRGIRVCLRPMTETQDGCGRLQIWFSPDRERIPGRVSDHWARWFSSFRLRSVHYARLAQETGCEMYCLDSELDRTIDQHDHWREVIAAVRTVYAGPVTSCHTTHCNLIDWDRELAAARHWWRDLDMLQLSCYECAAIAPGSDLDSMMARLVPVRERFRRLAGAYGKPIAFGECGCTSSVGGAMHPSGWTPQGGYDGEEQARYMEAVCRTFWDEPWWHGLFWWKWDEQNDRPQFRTDPRGDKGFTVWGKPAAEVMRAWCARARAARR